MRLPFLALAGALALACVGPATAQGYRVVASCGAQALRIGDGSGAFLDPTGNLCTASAGGGSPVVAGTQEQDVRAATPLNAATANAAVTLALNGQGTVGWTFTGLTASGATLTYEQSNDGGTTWTGINEVNAGTGVPAGTRTTDGQTRVSVSGRTNVRVRVSTPGAGTVTVASNISVREGIVTLGSPLPPGTIAIGSVLSDLRVAGAAVSSGNPVPALVSGLGAPGDAGWYGSGPGSINAIMQGVFNRLNAGLPASPGQKASSGSASVTIASDQSPVPTVVSASSTAGGLVTVSRIVSAAASANPTLAKSSAGRLYKVTGYNAAATIRWLKLYNKASAPTVGTDTPFFSLPLPPGAFSFDAQDLGYVFAAGIAYGLTTGAADGDATAVTAGDVLNLNIWYQ